MALPGALSRERSTQQKLKYDVGLVKKLFVANLQPFDYVIPPQPLHMPARAFEINSKTFPCLRHFTTNNKHCLSFTVPLETLTSVPSTTSLSLFLSFSLSCFTLALALVILVVLFLVLTPFPRPFLCAYLCPCRFPCPCPSPRPFPCFCPRPGPCLCLCPRLCPLPYLCPRPCPCPRL